MDATEKNAFSKFLIVWSGQLISNIGSGLTAFTLGVFAYQQTHSATCYALIILFSFLPSLLLKPVGGVLADRFDRRLMMIIGDLGSVLGLLFILGFILSGKIELWQIYAGVAITSLFSALQNPAYKASVSDFLTEEDYAKASGLMQLATSSQFLISPIIAGILFSVMEIKYILMIDISTFLVAVLAVFWVRRSRTSSRAIREQLGFFRELNEGFQLVASNKAILLLIGITTLICFYMGVLQTLFGPMVLSFASPKSFGIALSVCAIGLIFGSLLIGVFGGKNHVRTMCIFLGLAGLFYALIGLPTNLTLIVIPGFLFFFTLAFIQTSIEVLIRRNTDNDKQGRVWSLVSLITQLGYPLAYVLAGFLADYVFNPLLMVKGVLAPSIGRIIGVGQGRGIGLMFVVSGVLVVILAGVTGRLKVLRALDGGANG